MPLRVSCRELIKILHRSSLAIFDCLISETAVTNVSIAVPKSPNELQILKQIKYNDNKDTNQVMRLERLEKWHYLIQFYYGP